MEAAAYCINFLSKNPSIHFEITAHCQPFLPLALLTNFNSTSTTTLTTPMIRMTTSSRSRRVSSLAMSVAETEAGEEEGLVRVPYSGPSGSTFRDYKY